MASIAAAVSDEEGPKSQISGGFPGRLTCTRLSVAIEGIGGGEVLHESMTPRAATSSPLVSTAVIQ